jgi:hypothetical protein
MGAQPDGGTPEDGRGYEEQQGGQRDYHNQRDMEIRTKREQQRFMADEKPLPPLDPNIRAADGTPRPSGERDRQRSSRKGSGQLRICKKCGEPLTGQFVRALGGTFHLDCFKCRVSFSMSLLTSIYGH